MLTSMIVMAALSGHGKCGCAKVVVVKCKVRGCCGHVSHSRCGHWGGCNTCCNYNPCGCSCQPACYCQPTCYCPPPCPPACHCLQPCCGHSGFGVPAMPAAMPMDGGMMAAPAMPAAPVMAAPTPAPMAPVPAPAGATPPAAPAPAGATPPAAPAPGGAK